MLDGSNRDYLDGDQGARVREHHLRYTQALPLVPRYDDAGRPSATRGAALGACADEFEDTGGWPHQLYVRDARRHGRRARADASTTCSTARPQRDVVALGSYNIDVREVERTWRYLPEYGAEAAVFNEGYLSVRRAAVRDPVPLARRRGARTRRTCSCRSACRASHVAFGSVRMEPTLMLLGHAAGIAAAQAARRGVAVQDVDVAALQDDLRAAGQVL